MPHTAVSYRSIDTDSVLLQRLGNAGIQRALMLDYASHVALSPKFQAYYREAKPNLLAVWRRYDPFLVPGFVNNGHFALETDVHAIALAILKVVPGFFG